MMEIGNKFEQRTTESDSHDGHEAGRGGNPLLFMQERFQLKCSDFKPPEIERRKNKNRTRTIFGILVLCLNIGVNPPDVLKTSPCAQLECWVDPFSFPASKAVDTIGRALQMQYERCQPRGRFKLFLDPTVEAFKKACFLCRYSAKGERVLFHYNGHGVPRPTENGELWFFNTDYTKYTPFSVNNVRECLGSPTVCVFDCNNAGLVVKWFVRFYEQSRMEEKGMVGVDAECDSIDAESHILFGACSVNEMLSTNPDLPADVFTSCLTTPIRMNLRWYVSRTYIPHVTLDLVDQIPGCLNDRRTLLGELNWIFTAITDAIAWTVLPNATFHRLFRQDLLVACLLRNFFLAERIMRSCNCIPVSVPKLPSTHDHILWQSWDMVVDWYLSQLPDLINDPTLQFKHSTFFEEQLTSFETWLEFASEEKSPPQYLPIFPQVLLSQNYRMRALQLLARFLDLGPWAVDQCFNVGIFPYVLKLLQSSVVEMRSVLLFIWSKIIASYRLCQADIINENAHIYFVNALKTAKITLMERIQATFILTLLCDKFLAGKKAILNMKIFPICISHVQHPNPLLRRWMVLLMAKIWEDFNEAKQIAIKSLIHERLCRLLKDPVPEVRAATVYSLSTLIGETSIPPNIQIKLGLTIPVVNMGASPMVRKELVITLAHWINIYHDTFIPFVRRRLKLKKQALRLKAAKQKSITSSNSLKYNYYKKNNSDYTKKKNDYLGSLVDGDGNGREKECDLTLSMTEYANYKYENGGGGGDGRRLMISRDIDQSVDGEVFNGVYGGGGDGSVDDMGIGGDYMENPLSCSMGASIMESHFVFDFIWMNIGNLARDPDDSVARTAGILMAYYIKLACQKKEEANAEKGADQQEDSPNASGGVDSVDCSTEEEKKNSIYNSPLSLSMSSISMYLNKKSDIRDRMRKKDLICDDLWVEANSLKDHEPSEEDKILEVPFIKEIDPSVPLLEHKEFKSTFFEWSCSFWSMSSSSVEDQINDAKVYWSDQNINRIDNEQNDSCSESLWLTPSQHLKDEIAIFNNNNSNSNYNSKKMIIRSLKFHSFESVVFSCDEKEVKVWNWRENEQVGGIFCDVSSHMTCMDLLNESYSVLVATGHEDSSVRVWDGIYCKPRVLTAWNVLGDVSTLSGTRSKLVLEWRAKQERLVATGNFNLVRIWNLNNEMVERDLPTSFEVPVTCLAGDKDEGGNLVIIGNASGSIQLFDLRRKHSSLVALNAYEGHKILSISLSKILQEMFISGATNGEVKFWDLRNWGVNIRNILTSPLSTFAIHERLPIFALGSLKQKIKIFNFSGDLLSTIMYHEGFLGRRITPISCLNFHSYYPLLATSEFSSLISIYAGKSFF